MVQKIGYGYGGYPPPPLYGQNFRQKGSYGFGGYPPPPLRTKSAKKYLKFSLTRTSGDVAHSSILFLSDPCKPGLIFFFYISIDNVYIDTSYFCLYPLNPTTRILHSSSSSSFSVTKIRVHFPLTLFLKYDQLDLFKASGIISDYLTSIFPKHFLIF